MEAHKVDMFIMANANFFEEHQLIHIRERLLALDDSRWFFLQTMNFLDPSVVLILSILVGHFGVDRFYLRDTGMGIAKLLSCGGFGIWTIIDWFLIMRITRRKNLERLMRIMY